MTVKDALVAGKTLIWDEEHWTQGAYGRTAKGGTELLGIELDKATCFCAMGALGVALGMSPYKVENSEHPAYLALAKNTPRGMVIEFNDTHTHAEVLALFDKAIAAA